MEHYESTVPLCVQWQAFILIHLSSQHPTWHLVSSKRHFHWADVVVVDEAGSCLQVRSHTVGSSNVSAGRKKIRQMLDFKHKKKKDLYIHTHIIQ